MKKRILNLLIAFSMLCSMMGSNVLVSVAQKEESLPEDGISIEKATEHDFEKIEETANDTKTQTFYQQLNRRKQLLIL